MLSRQRVKFVSFCSSRFSFVLFFFSCECTESRLSSIHRPRPRRSRRRTHRSRLQTNLTQGNVPLSTFTSTSYRSDDVSDEDIEEEQEEEEDVSMINADERQFLSPVSNLIGHLPPPDLVQSMMNDDYRHHLQQMADLSNQQRFHEQSMPFFGQDHVESTDPTAMPTSSLEKTILFH